ncbi:MAG: tetratricopeptide repeat protein [Verrucomicrobiales bacterium]|nr:tetratricopeptide repeat protein [Verrucomicrobiales bacterium]
MKRTVAWLLPPLSTPLHRLAPLLTKAQALADSGWRCHLFFAGDDPPAARARLLQDLCGSHAFPHHPAAGFQGHFDLAIATHWEAACQLAASHRVARRLRLVSDFEPWLYPMGSAVLRSEQSYRLGFPTITQGRWLAAKLTREFHVSCRPVDFGVAPALFRPLSTRKELAVCFWHLPGFPELAGGVGLEALNRLHGLLPTVKIYLFGALPERRVPAAFTQLGPLPPDRRNELYNRCRLGLCLPATNPSHLPFEMLAAGLPVLGLHGESSRHDFPDTAVALAEPSAAALKTALRDLLGDGARRQAMAEAGPRWMADRTDLAEARQFVEAVATAVRHPDVFPARAETLEPIHRAPALGEIAPVDPAFVQRSWSLVTYDVWDTVLRRRCHPDEIKLHTARYLLLKWSALVKQPLHDARQLMQLRVQCEHSIGERERAAGFDNEYGLREVLLLWVSLAANRPLAPAETDALADELLAAEIRQEKLHVYADPQFPALLAQLRARRQAFASDFYLPADTLRELLRHAGVRLPGLDGVSSCDARLNKRSGRLLQHLRTQTGVPAPDHLHLGDNEFSDVFIPRVSGARSVHFWNPAEEHRRARLQRRFQLRPRSARPYFQELTAGLRQVTAPSDWPEPHRDLFAHGVRFAPLLLGFAHFVAEEALLGGFPAVYFFTREGEFFQQLYETLAREDVFGLPLPPAHLLEVSRLATFAASVARPGPDELMRIWTLYSSQSMEGLLRSFDVEPADFVPFLRRHHLNPGEEITHPWRDTRVRRLLEDAEFLDRLAAHCRERRALLKAYLAARGLSETTPRAALVDIGWRGTIQDNLARVLPETQLTGWYLGLHRFLNPQPANTLKRAFGPNANRPGDEPIHLLEFVSPIEMLCNSDRGSVLRYRRGQPLRIKNADSPDGVVAERERNPSEDAVFEHTTRFFQAGVLAAGAPFSRFLRCHALANTELRPFALELLASLTENPPAALARAYFGLNHNETFGLGRYENKSRHLARLDTAHQLHTAGDRDQFHRFLAETTWPQGFLLLGGLHHHFNLRIPPDRRPLPPAHHAEARAALRRAAASLQQRDWTGARTHALRSLALWPHQLRAHVLLFHVNLCLEQPALALQHFAVVQACCPNHAPALNELAVKGYREGYRAEPRELWTDLLEKHPTCRAPLLNLARLHLQDGQPDAAARLLVPFLERKPRDAEAAALALLATVGSLQTGRARIRNWLQTLDGHPAILPLATCLNGALGPAADPAPDGLPHLAQAGQVSLEPTSDLAYLEHEADANAVAAPCALLPAARPPRLHAWFVEPPQAPADSPRCGAGFQPALAAHADSPLRRATEHLNQGRPADALALLDDALRACPAAPRLHFGRAVALARLGRFPEAAQALELVPEPDRQRGRLRRLTDEMRARTCAATCPP